jgi:hypothetical protein
MAASWLEALALATAASSVLWSSPVAATSTPDIETTGSLITPRVPAAGGVAPNQDGTAGRATRIRSAIGPDLCVSLRLPGVWKVERPQPHRIDVIDAQTGARIEITAYTDADLPPGPETLIQRAASNLQQEYERLLGKPAQVTTLDPVPIYPAMRWTATWIDGNLAHDDRALSLEEFIMEPVPNRILEVAVSRAKEHGGDVIGRALETLRVQRAAACPP